MQFYIKKICHILLCNNRKKNPLSHAYLMSKSFSLKFYNSFTSRCESGLGREASLGFVEKLCKSVHAYCIHSAYCILYTECTDAHCNNAQMQAYTSQIGSESLKWCHHCGGGNGARERNSECKGVCSGFGGVEGMGGGLHVVGVGVGLYLSGGRDSWKST